MRWSLVVAACAIFVLVRTASAQPAPVTIDADVITYDAAQQVIIAEGNVRAAFRQYRLFADAARYDVSTGVVSATGRVRLVDPDRQELRARALTLNIRTGVGALESAEGVVERLISVRADRLEVGPDLFVAHDSVVTTCDPRRPLYRIVARRVEIIPSQEIVAHEASIYLGSRRLFTLMRYVISLRPDRPAVLLPGVGSNAVDGFWVDYRLPVRVRRATGDVHLKSGALSGVFGLLTLTYRAPAVSTTLRLGRTQTADARQAFDLLAYHVAEIRAATRPVPIGRTPFSGGLTAAAGWFSEDGSGLTTTRLDGEVSVASRPLPVGSGLALTTTAAYRLTSYGTGATRTIASLSAALAYQLDRYTVVTLGYALAAIQGSTPLVIDVVDPANTTSLAVERAVPGRYRLAASVAANTALSETKYYAAVAAFVSPTLEVGASALYNTRLAALEDLDYHVRVVCDCLDVAIRYRQVRRAVFIEFGLTGLPERGAPFIPRAGTR